MPKLQDIAPGTVFETSDGRRFVKADHLDQSKRAKGQWECVSLDDGSHPKAFPEVNHEEVTPIPYFDAGPVKAVADIEPKGGTVIEVVESDDHKHLVGQRLLSTTNGNLRSWVKLQDGGNIGTPPTLGESKARILYDANDPKTTEAHNELQDIKDNQADLMERLGALRNRLEEAFGPMGLTNPDGAENLLQDALDALEGILNPG